MSNQVHNHGLLTGLDGVAIDGVVPAEARTVLEPKALNFVGLLQREFNAQREQLLQARAARQAEISAGKMPDFLHETAAIRDAEWVVAPTPADLLNRRVEITGPVERKMMINALNSGASVFMADFEDALSPTWQNVLLGQRNLMQAVRHTLAFTSPQGKDYRLNSETATLVVRPRGWHLLERHVTVDGQPISASLFDFGLYFYHNARESLARASGPYFYLPKLESHHEARLWNDVFNFAQDALNVPRGSIRATVLIETVLAAFEMDEILHALREHASGLNAGRWDYIFSAIKKFRARPALELPDRAQITMTAPFMRAYTELLVKTCHRRGAHAMGGMAAFIPNRKDLQVTELALGRVREDKEREAADGFDGTWVAHPDLVPVAKEAFDRVLGSKPHQKQRKREEVEVAAGDLSDLRVPGGSLTEAGLRNNVSVALHYLSTWLQGNGAVAIFDLMEDAATAEIARGQLWFWVRRGAALTGGRKVTPGLYKAVRDEELTRLGGRAVGRLHEAANLLDELVLNEDFPEFFTLLAYPLID